jgi:hypothetical protein
MQTLVIDSDSSEKGRSFSAHLMASVEAPFDLGQGPEKRPVWAMVGGTDAAVRAVVWNLRSGKRAMPADARGKASEAYLFPKSVAFHVAWQKAPQGTLATLFLPDLFRLDIGMVDPEGVCFYALPLASQLEAMPEAERERAADHVLRCRPDLMRYEGCTDREWLVKTAPLAMAFLAYLDRRTRLPLLPDSRFALQLLTAFCRDRLAGVATVGGYGGSPPDCLQAYRHDSIRQIGTGEIGLARGLYCSATHEKVAAVVAAESALYFTKAT